MLRLILAAIVAAGLIGLTPGHALAHDELPDAAIFATSNTAVITDPDDPRLDKRLLGFEAKVERIVNRGGGAPRGSKLLDGVFFSSELGTTTFERSRSFDVDHVSTGELTGIARRIAKRFRQESVLTSTIPSAARTRPTPSRSRCRGSTRSACATACCRIGRRRSGCSAAR